MKPITDTASIPSHPTAWPYVQIDNEQCGWVRVPSPGQVEDALKAAEPFTGAAKLEAQLGATIRLGWMSHTLDLESTEPRAVYQELHNAGWRIDQIAELSNVITELFSQSTTTDADVEDAADFSGGTQPNG